MKRPFVPTLQQTSVIELDGGAHLVVAPPGSGKTQILTERIVRLLGKPGETFRILALTFTTKAAETLWQRVRTRAARESGRVRACTFHAFCLDLLQSYGKFVDFSPRTALYEQHQDRIEILRRAAHEEGLSYGDEKNLQAILLSIGELKRNLTPPGGVDDEQLSEMYSAYQRLMRNYGGCDFDDILYLCWKLVNENPQVARHTRSLYRHIMVDEAQDTSRAQYEILRCVCQHDRENVMLAADAGQFIYGFTGASSAWLERFVSDFEAERHELTENFRSARRIADVATRLRSSLPDPPGSDGSQSTSVDPALGMVQGREYIDEQEEAEGVVDWIEGLLEVGFPPRILHVGEDPILAHEDLAVLARNRYSLDLVAHELERRSVPHLFRVASRGLLETPEARLIIQGLRILQNDSDRVTRDRVIAEWAPQLAHEELYLATNGEFFETLAAASAEVRTTMLTLRDQSQNTTDGHLAQFVRALLSTLDNRAASGEANTENDAHSLLLKGDFSTLSERWDAYAAQRPPEGRTVSGFMGELALAGQSVLEGEGVRLLTIHAAKGLEFRAVALVGMNEGTLPDYRSGGEEGLKAEQRVAYVAVTRASRALLLTRPRSRVMPWGDRRGQTASRFLEKMDVRLERRGSS